MLDFATQYTMFECREELPKVMVASLVSSLLHDQYCTQDEERVCLECFYFNTGIVAKHDHGIHD